MTGPCLYICVRKDLKMGVGKIAAQAIHASRQLKINTNPKSTSNRAWELNCNKTIVLKLDNEEELNRVKQYCITHKVPIAVQVDAGFTQVPSNTTTCIACGIVNDENSFHFFSQFKLL